MLWHRPRACTALGELWHVFIRNFTKSPDPTVTGKFCRRAAGIAAQNRGHGEAVAISILRDQKHTYNETFAGFTFIKFDGTTITI